MQDDQSQTGARPWHRSLAAWIPWVAAAGVLWARFLVLPSFVTPQNVDEAWALSLVYFFEHGAQAGTDYVFPYGPLGAFVTRAYDPAFFWPRYAWELVVKLVAVVFLLRALAEIPSRGWRLAAGALLFLFVPFQAEGPYLVALIACGMLLLGPTADRPGWRIVQVLFLAVVSLTKFNAFLLAFGAVALAEGVRRWRGYRGFLSPLPLYLAAFLGTWTLAGQRWGNLPQFFAHWLELARGYGEAMSLPARADELGVGIAALLLTGTLLAAVAWTNRRSPFHVGAALFLGWALALAWKHGFTRSDSSHVPGFFVVTAFLAVLLPRFLTRPAGRLALIGLLLLSALGDLLGRRSEPDKSYLAQSLQQSLGYCRDALAPAACKARLDAERAQSVPLYDLPVIRAAVGDSSVETLGYRQGAILLSGLNWQPRPVFHAYSAYTPALLRLNAAHFSGPAAPEYVLADLRPIDGRLAAGDDAPTLLAVLHSYYPVLSERMFVLLRRLPPDEEGPAAEPLEVCRRTIRLGEELSLTDLPGDYQTLTLTLTPTVVGAARGACYQRGPVHLRLRTASGRATEYRLVPATAAEGFLINPLVNSTSDYVRLYGPAAADRVLGFSVVAGGGDYRDQVGVVVRALPRLPCRTITAEAVERLLGP
jgi:hypothetical protein